MAPPRSVLLYQRADPHGDGLGSVEIVGPERHEGVETEQHRRRPGDGFVRPLPLGFDAELTANFSKGDLDGPASDKPAQDLLGAGFLIGAKKCLRLKGACRVSHEKPAQRHHGLAWVAPDRETAGDLHPSL